MDGAAPSLPPISAPVSPMSPGGFSRPAPPMSPGVMPVGRPAADPEVQQQRVERSAERKRIEGVAPKALDSRCQVFKTKDGKIMPGAKPVLSIVVKELEEAALDGQTTDDVVASKLMEKFPTGGKFVGRFVDKAGRPVQDSTWDILIGDEPDLTAEPAEPEDDDSQGLDLGFQSAQGFQMQPPAPPVLDTTALTGALRAERQDEAKRGSEIATLIAHQQNSTTQMMLQLAEQNRLAEERARKDAAEREERADKRRTEFRQTLIGLLGTAPILAIIERFLGPKKDPAPSTTDQMMIEMFRAKMSEKPEKGFDMVMMAEMSKLMQSVVQGNLTQQQEQAKAAGAMQAEVLGVTMKTALSTMKEIAEMKPGGEKEEGTLAQIAKIAGPFLASMQQQAQVQQTAPPTTAELQTQAPAGPPQAEVVDEPRRQRRGKVPPPPALAQQPAAAPAAAAQPPRRPRNPADLPDVERIRVSLDAIRRLSTGEIEPGSRFNLLTWMQKMAPASLLEAVKAGDQDKIMELGTPTVLANPVLMDWVNQDYNVKFLMGALSDLKLMLDGTISREHMDNAIIDTDRFVKAHQPTPGQTAGPPQATVITTEKPEEPKADTPPAPAPAAPQAEAAPAAAKTRRPRVSKQLPPATPADIKPTEPPAAAKSEG